MSYHHFESLKEDKKKHIINIATKEFVENGYEGASTNHMTKAMGISKGSLFHYFGSKEALYLYIVDQSVTQVVKRVNESMVNIPDDFIEFIKISAVMEFDLYIENPQMMHLFKEAFSGKTEISKKILKHYRVEADQFFDQMTAEYDFPSSAYKRDYIMNVFRWVLKGLNDNFLDEINTLEDNGEKLKHRYLNELNIYLNMLKQLFNL